VPFLPAPFPLARWTELARKHAAWLIALLVAVTYLPSWSGGYLVYDDDWLVEENPILRLPFAEAAAKIVFDLTHEARLRLGAEYLPVRDLSYLFDVQVLGLGAPGMRLEQVLLYIAAVLMLRAALLNTLPSRLAAELAVSCFALHPVHVESVAWIAGRKDVLALVFVAAALWAYSSRRTLAWTAVPLLLGAHFSKSMSVVAVGLLLAQDLLARRRPRWAILSTAAGAALAAAALHYLVGRSVAMLGGPFQGQRWAAFYTMGEVWLAYLRTLVWPAQLSIVYEVPRRVALGLASALGWALLAGGGVLGVLRWRKGSPVPLAAWLWLVLPLVPVSQVLLPLENVQADRYLWLSVLGLGLALPALWQLHAAGRLAVLVLLAGCFGASVWRAHAFGDGADLFAQATRATEGMRAPYLLAKTLEQRGDAAGAEAAYWLTLERPCEAPCEVARRASNNLARLLVHTGRADRAEPLLRQALERFPDDPKVHFNLVKVLERLGKRAEARELYARAQATFPHYAASVR